MAWWDSIDRRERSLLNMLLLFYISSLLGLLVLFIGIPITILIIVFDFYGL
jgi:positive regulator of sigma E activity